MRSFIPGLLATALFVLLADRATAQGPGGGLLGNPSVQKELKITPDQTREIRDAMQGVQQKYGDDFRQAFQDRDQKKIQEISQKIQKETSAKLKKVLKPEQYKRFKQIEMQVNPLQALSSPEVQKDLNLSDKQKDEIKKITQDLMKKSQSIFQDAQGDQDKMREAFTKTLPDLRKKAQQKATDTLTDEQKKSWKEMTGKPFKLEPQRFGPGGGRPRPARP